MRIEAGSFAVNLSLENQINRVASLHTPEDFSSTDGLTGNPSRPLDCRARQFQLTARYAALPCQCVAERLIPDGCKGSVELHNRSARDEYHPRDTLTPGMSTLILRLESTGQPLRWIGWQEAVVLNAKGRIAWSAGETEFTFHGGVNRATGTRSKVTVNSIIAVKGHGRRHSAENIVPPLSNRELFLRDGNTCMYCGGQFPDHLLTRDHLVPLSRGGRNGWKNVVAACRSCNHAKGARTPEEARMELLAVPYSPNRAEYLVLSNRRILVDQMEFLRKRFRSGSRMAVS